MKISNNVKAIAQRMVRAAASSALSVLVIGNGVNALSIDYTEVAGIAGGAALVSLLLSLAGQATSGNGPAFGKVEEVKPE